VLVTHGYREPVVRWLREHGLQAQAIASKWEGDEEEGAAPELEEPAVASEGPET